MGSFWSSSFLSFYSFNPFIDKQLVWSTSYTNEKSDFCWSLIVLTTVRLHDNINIEPTYINVKIIFSLDNLRHKLSDLVMKRVIFWRHDITQIWIITLLFYKLSFVAWYFTVNVLSICLPQMVTFSKFDVKPRHVMEFHFGKHICIIVS